MHTKPKDDVEATAESAPVPPGYRASSQAGRNRRTMVETLVAALNADARISSDEVASTPAYIGFQLGELYYAAPLENIIQVERPSRPVPAPNAPEIVLGVTNVRGEVVCLVDLRRLLGLPPTSGGAPRRLIRVRGGSLGLEAGVIVDSAFPLGSGANLSTADSTDPSAPRLLSINQLLDSPPLVELCA